MRQGVAVSAEERTTMLITARMGGRLGALAGLALAALFLAPPLEPDAAGASEANPIVGTWSRLTTCRQLVAVLEKASLGDAVLDSVSGNGFVPGVTQPDQIVDPADPCAGAVPRKHSHFFTADGHFGSLDWRGDQVDEGTYRIGQTHTISIRNSDARVRLQYRIVNVTALVLDPILPACAARTCFAAVWGVSVAYPGRAWHRTRR
jgi:hypothetical protein